MLDYVIASEAKQSRVACEHRKAVWIASSLCSSQ
jgi:hypothetical protein